MPIIIAVIILLFSSTVHADAFQSEELRQLWDVPSGEVKAQTVKTYSQGSIKVEEVYYLSRSFKRKPVKIFGYFCYPRSRAGKLPAILLSHGGGGTASRPRAVAWARRGYAVLAIDLPGKGENRGGSRSTGPDMIVPILLRTQPDPSYNYLIHAVAAARNGITYLTQRKEVDPNRIGMIGLSWGGVLTLLTNGQDERLKAAVNVFGAGFIPEGCTWEDRFFSMPALDKEIWNTYIDPKNFLATQHAPILFITGTNDHCYYLPTFQKSYEQVKVEKNYWLIPNLRHRFLDSAQAPALAWLDQKLKRSIAADIFPKISELPAYKKGPDKIVIPITASVHSVVKSARLYYTDGGPLQWTAKKWKELKPHYESGVYSFGLPVGLLKPEILYYVSVKDNHGGASSTLVRSLFKVKLIDGTKTYAISSSIRKIFRHEKPVTLLGGADAGNTYFYYSKKDKIYEVFRSQ
ncbi:MAG: acetylxylan esterase [Candidatus Margulisbacteria bacterium]|nr:acetylxylan esterase [Candidatus Margulisiibacteriota bacterium]